jgi:hypothetical protein
MTPPTWLIYKVLDAMKRYPDALRMATPRKEGEVAKGRRRDRESLRQRREMVKELMAVYPRPTVLARLLELDPKTVYDNRRRAGLTTRAGEKAMEAA